MDGILSVAAWNAIKPQKGYNRHHRVPRRVGGRNTFRNISILSCDEHSLWHAIYGARCAAYTLAVEHKIQRQLGLDERTAIIDARGEGSLYVPSLEVDLTRHCLAHYEEFRAGRSQQEYYDYINQRMNDPFYKWIKI